MKAYTQTFIDPTPEPKQTETLKVTVELSPIETVLFRARKTQFGGFPPSDARLAKGMLEAALRDYWLAQPAAAKHLDALTLEVLRPTPTTNTKESTPHVNRGKSHPKRKRLERPSRKK